MPEGEAGSGVLLQHAEAAWLGVFPSVRSLLPVDFPGCHACSHHTLCSGWHGIGLAPYGTVCMHFR